MSYMNNEDALIGLNSIRELIPTDLKEAFEREFRKFATPQLVGCSEFIYAHRDDLPEEVVMVGRDLMSYCVAMKWHGLDEGRGAQCILAMTRVLKEKPPIGYKAQKPEDDPEPRADFAPPPPEEEAIPEGATEEEQKASEEAATEKAETK